jgi:alkylated DNA nucleotide flippase Atl1
MAKVKSTTFIRIRAEVIRLVALIPEGKFTTYGSIAVHMNMVARHVATVMRQLTEEESAWLPWHRVVSADARISPNMAPETQERQKARGDDCGCQGLHPRCRPLFSCGGPAAGHPLERDAVAFWHDPNAETGFNGPQGSYASGSRGRGTRGFASRSNTTRKPKSAWARVPRAWWRDSGIISISLPVAQEPPRNA